MTHTAKWWFQNYLPPTIAKKAIRAKMRDCYPGLRYKATSLCDALVTVFSWARSDEGFGYWNRIFYRAQSGKYSRKQPKRRKP